MSPSYVRKITFWTLNYDWWILYMLCICCEPRKFIIVVTKILHSSLSWATSVKFQLLRYFFFNIPPFKVLDFPSGLLPINTPFAPFHSPYAPQASPIQMFLIWSPEYLLKLKIPMQSVPVTSHLLQNTFLSTLFSNTLVLCSSIRMPLSQ